MDEFDDDFLFEKLMHERYNTSYYQLTGYVTPVGVDPHPQNNTMDYNGKSVAPIWVSTKDGDYYIFLTLSPESGLGLSRKVFPQTKYIYFNNEFNPRTFEEMDKNGWPLNKNPIGVKAYIFLKFNILRFLKRI